MLRYFEGGIALAFLLGAVAACDGRTVLLNASAQSAGVNSMNPQGGARVNTGDAAMSAETVGRQAWGDSLAVLIEWHVDSVRRYEIRQCRPDDQPAEQMSELSEAVLDGPESAQVVGAQTATQRGMLARPKEGDTCTAVHLLPSGPWLSCP